MRKKFGIAVVVALLAAPVVVHAQGIIGGMHRGAADGNYSAGPVGGAVGGVNGALGINPGPRYESRSAYYHRRYHRHYYHHHY
jgi:hypothetical protein